MDLFDLHCDTVYKVFREGKNIYDDYGLAVDIKKLKKIDNYIGCFAIWVPSEYRGKDALNYFLNSYKEFVKIKEKIILDNSKKIILSVEGSVMLNGNIDNVNILKECGVKILTLTWNGSCEAGDGINVKKAKGLTKFGIKLIEELEKNNIVVDISHASENLFYDVLKYSKRPFIASHSNSKNVCNHPRNLTYDQFRIIKNINGIVGINFHKNFLTNSDNVKIGDIFYHIEYFLSISGENNICIGSDFDGADVLDEINNISKVYKLYEFMLKKNYNEKLIKKIFFDNARNFFQKYIIFKK